MRFSTDKKITIAEIAEKAGVSPSAVSRYLNNSGYVAEDKRAAIESAMKALNVKTENETRITKARSRKVFGIIIPPLSGNVQFERMGSFFSAMAKNRGYSTKIYPVDLAANRLDDVLRSIQKDNLSGIFIPVVPMLELDAETQKTIAESDTPIVMLSEFPEPYPEINSIVNNFGAGIKMALAHLAECGCRNIALLTPSVTQSKSAALQQKGFIKYIDETGPWESWQITEYNWSTHNFSHAGYECAKLAFEKNPDIDGIIGWVDSYTAGIMWYLYERGKRVPDDVKIITCNDDYAEFLCPPVTTYSLSNEVACSEAVDMLIRLQKESERENVKHVYLTPKMTVRKSTKTDR